jgi:hypothetical protein
MTNLDSMGRFVPNWGTLLETNAILWLIHFVHTML